MIECRKFRIEGRVQGVWFRESTRQQAGRLGITGYALNCPDGSVEVLACGNPQAVASLQAWLHSGPRMARVGGVTEQSYTGDCPERFNTA